jgi:hypothetical protein
MARETELLVVEAPASHSVFVSQPDAVASLIKQASAALSR